MEVKLVHPSDPEKKVITATDEQQVAAFRSHGFVDESDLADASTSDEAAVSTEKLARIKAENKALKSENTKLKNKLGKTDESDAPAPDVNQTGTAKDGADPKEETR